MKNIFSLNQLMESGFYKRKQILADVLLKLIVRQKSGSTPDPALDLLLSQTPKPITFSDIFRNIFILLFMSYFVSVICVVIENYLKIFILIITIFLP